MERKLQGLRHLTLHKDKPRSNPGITDSSQLPLGVVPEHWARSKPGASETVISNKSKYIKVNILYWSLLILYWSKDTLPVVCYVHGTQESKQKKIYEKQFLIVKDCISDMMPMVAHGWWSKGTSVEKELIFLCNKLYPIYVCILFFFLRGDRWLIGFRYWY